MMNKRFLLTLAFFISCTFIAAAQEEHFPDPIEEREESRVEETNQRESGMQIWEADRIQRETPKENVSRPVIPESPMEKKEDSAQEKSSATKESVLSFNFLYYLIEKFKLSEADQ